MSKKIFIIGSVLILIAVGFLVSSFWFYLTDFYKDCISIKKGMSEEEAESIMSSYMNNGRFSYSREGALWGPGLYVSSNSSGNACNIRIRDGRVDEVEARFE